MKGSTIIGILFGTCAAAALTAAVVGRLVSHPIVGFVVGAAWGAVALVLLWTQGKREP